MSQDQQAAYTEARQLQLQSLIGMIARHELVDGILLVTLQKDPANPDRTYFSFLQEGIQTVQMIGIINKLMSDINKVFADSQLDVPFPDAKPFVKSIPPNEG